VENEVIFLKYNIPFYCTALVMTCSAEEFKSSILQKLWSTPMLLLCGRKASRS